MTTGELKIIKAKANFADYMHLKNKQDKINMLVEEQKVKVLDILATIPNIERDKLQPKIDQIVKGL